ncbi:hypothetical protein ENBRE01_2897 [Enteropsectra breve]|nr:hypothetical protein ENBRE01_2897 [Enteropsectra breve]
MEYSIKNKKGVNTNPASLGDPKFFYALQIANPILMGLHMGVMFDNVPALAKDTTILYDFVFMLLSTPYLFWLTVKSIKKNEVYGYILSIFVKIYKVIALISTLDNIRRSLNGSRDPALVIFFSLKIVEIIYQTVFLYLRRNEIKFYLVKQVGGDPEINKALARRQILSAAASLHIFGILYLIFLNITYPRLPFSLSDLMNIIFCLINAVSQLFMMVDFYGEDRLQRKIGIFILAISILGGFIFQTAQTALYYSGTWDVK